MSTDYLIELKPGDLIFIENTKEDRHVSSSIKISDVALSYYKAKDLLIKPNHTAIYITNFEIIEAIPPVISYNCLSNTIAKNYAQQSNSMLTNQMFKTLYLDTIGNHKDNPKLVMFEKINAYQVATLEINKTLLKKIIIKRARDPNLIIRAIDYIKQHVNSPYNQYYLQDTMANGFYCSQLITEGFRYANYNRDIFDTHSLKFGGTDDHSYWSNYYGGSSFIPYKQMGSHPASLMNSPYLDTIFSSQQI